MILGVDASNIRAGGGLTYLIEVLRASQTEHHQIEKIIVWSGRATLDSLGDYPWLIKHHERLLDRLLLFRFCWGALLLDHRVEREHCDLLLVPGGIHHGGFSPHVAICQNLLPFEMRESSRYGFSIRRWRYDLLRRMHTRSFSTADGVIFLTDYARRVVEAQLPKPPVKTVVIPHGISARFRREPRPQRGLDHYSEENPFRFVYVSIVNLYKHQWNVAEAIGQLRSMGLPLAIDFVGPAYGPALRKLQKTMDRWDPDHVHLRYLGPASYDQMHHIYHSADAFVFASSCENMPMILMEAMASGLPIACSLREPMPEVLGDAAVYFDPEHPQGIAESLLMLLTDQGLREDYAWAVYRRAERYTWVRCAHETFAFLVKIAQLRMNM